MREGRIVPGGSIADGRVFLQDSSHLQAIGIDTGEVLWTHPLPANWFLPPPFTVGDLVVAADPDSVVGFDGGSGRPLWKAPIARARWFGACGDDLYVHGHDQRSIIHRLQAADGRLVALMPAPGLPRTIGLDGEELVLVRDRASRLEEARLGGRNAGEGDGGERLDGPGDATLTVWSRWRGERRWDRVFSGRDALLLPPVTAGGRLVLVQSGRVTSFGLDGRACAGRPLTEPATCLLAAGDRVLLATGGLNPRVELLGPTLELLRWWGLPEPALHGAATPQLVALAGLEGVYFLDLATGQRWGLSGLAHVGALALDRSGHVVAFRRSGSSAADTASDWVIGLGLE
jgi:hypothetical protein